MKKRLFYLLLLVSGIASAQIVNIPDANFKNKLLSASTSNSVAKNEAGNAMVIDTNGDDEIQESEAELVWYLDLNGAGMSNVTGLEAFSNLRTLFCSASGTLASLDITSLTNLEHFRCDDGTGLDALNFAGLPNLKKVHIMWTNLDTIDLTGLTGMEQLNLHNVPVTHLDFSDMVNLQYLGCLNTYMESINLNNSPMTLGLFCAGNDFLELISIKNGEIIQNPNSFIIGTNPMLKFFCIDEEELAVVQEISGLEGINIGSYCSFIPGGDYNTITGSVIFDADGNGCDSQDLLNPFFKVEADNGDVELATFTNSSGEYAFYTGQDSFTITPQFENDWFVATPPSAEVTFSDINNNVHTENFCITSVGEHPDLEVIIVPVTDARPGFDAVYKVIYRNKGNLALSGAVTCGFDYPVLTEVAVAPMPDTTVPGTYTWNFDNLLPFESREILITLNVNSPTETPAVNSGDILSFTVAVESEEVMDETPEDNSCNFKHVVVGSLDPNNIVCIEGNAAPVDSIGDYLHYIVNFENIGDAPASFVVVKHMINTEDFDISSLQVLSSSHTIDARIHGNKVEFIFDDINLAAEEYGSVVFKIKTLNTLEEGDSVINQADIFFDYNFPLATNEANTLFGTLSVDEFEADNSVKIYPVPAQNHVTIEAESTIESVSLFDAQGRVLQTNLVNDRQAVLDMSSRQSGIYFLKVTIAEGVKVQQVIKK